MEVVVYMNDKCGFCNKQKEWLDKNNITYLEKNIVNDEAAYLEFLQQKGQGTPLTVIKKIDTEVRVLGFNVKKLENSLGLN